jgi:hypothetical protein
MATYVQSTGVQSVGSVDSVSKGFVSNVTAGNLLVVACVSDGADMPEGVLADSLGAAWRRVNARQRGSAPAAEVLAIFVAVAPASGACSVTLNVAGSDYQTIGLLEVSPTPGYEWPAVLGDLADGLGGADTGDNPTTNTPAVPSFPAQGTGVVVGMMTHASSSSLVLTPDAGWVQAFEDENAANMPLNFAYQLSVNGGTFAPSWVMSFAASWTAIGAGFKEQPAGGYPPQLRTDFRSFQKIHLKDYTDEEAVEGV